MTDWSEHTIELKKLSQARDFALNGNNLARAIVLQGEINRINEKLTDWMRDNYK